MSKSKFDVIALAKQSGCIFDSRDNAVFSIEALIKFNNLLVEEIRDCYKPNDGFKTITIKRLHDDIYRRNYIFGTVY